MKLSVLVNDARACTICAKHLPLGPRPLLQAAPASRIVIIGQAPGKAAHETGVPWDDRSGERLRDWLGIDTDTFYDARKIALLPMGFCYPGTGTSGDLPPRPECAPEWHAKLLTGMRKLVLTIYVGQFAFKSYIGREFKNVTEAARNHARLLPMRMALPHPSPRNNIWLKKNPWFGDEVLPRLRRRVRAVLK